jgi:hypothetical protein
MHALPMSVEEILFEPSANLVQIVKHRHQDKHMSDKLMICKM